MGEKLILASQKIKKSAGLEAIRNSFVLLIPLVLIHSFLLVLLEFPLSAYQNFIQSPSMKGVLAFFQIIDAVMINYFGIYLAMAIGWYYAVSQKKKDRTKWTLPCLTTGIYVLSVGAFSEDFNIEYLGEKGIFSAVVVSVLVCIFYSWVSRGSDGQGRKLDYLLDPELAGTIKSVLPTVLTLAFFVLCHKGIVLIAGEHCLQDNVMNLIQNFLGLFSFSELLQAVWYVLCVHGFWWLGIHGQNALFDISDGVYRAVLDHNISVSLAGGVPDGIVNNMFSNTFVYIGGAGATLSLMIVILLVSKNRNQKGIVKVGLLPALLNVNELVIYGFPLVLNPIYVIPFVCAPLANLMIAYGATALGIIPVVARQITWTTPVLFNGYMATGTIAGVVLQLVLLVIDALIYLPFVKLSDREQVYTLQKQTEELTAAIRESEEYRQKENFSNLDYKLEMTAYLLKNDLQKAITERSDKLYMRFQPQYDRMGHCIGSEALLRFEHPIVGYLYPPLIIELAKSFGLLPELEKIIFDQTCAAIQKMNEMGRTECKISVNITSVSLSNPDFEHMVRTAMKCYDVKADQLWMEITEQDALASTEEAVAKMMRLKRSGHKLLIDDFGMGHTSINYLQTNLFDVVKLDGSITTQVLLNRRDREIISSIVKLSKELELLVVAEYVEDEEQKEELKRLGCDMFQGHLYSKAVVLEEFLAVLSEEMQLEIR